jgi:hypothetical protein
MAPPGCRLLGARELCIDAKRAISEGRSPAIEKQREKRRLLEARSFGEFGEKWLTVAPMADSTQAMRRSIFEREPGSAHMRFRALSCPSGPVTI